MYINTPPLHCSKCDSIDSENFSSSHSMGIRCKKCGHEKVTSTTRTDIATGATGYKYQEKYVNTQPNVF